MNLRDPVPSPVLVSIRPKDLIFTLLGDYVLPRGGEIWTGSLIELLRILGSTSDQAVRSALSRLSRRGWLQSRRSGRRSYYSLTARGRRLLQEGAERIYIGRRGDWDGRWWLVSYRVPERRRKWRARLRRELAWLGLGRLAASLYVTPYDPRRELEALFEKLERERRMRVRRYLDLFTAEHLDGDSRQLARQAWDLEGINARYRAFLSQYQPLHQTDRSAGRRLDPAASFVRRFMLTHEYRLFPWLDPDLPGSLLPEDWLGHEARQLFQAYHDLLTGPALEHFDRVFQGGQSG